MRGAAATVAMMAAVAVRLAGQSGPPPPTFTKDVAPIVYAKCAECHRPGEVAPMSLLSYEEARPWARVIKSKVAAHDMPPWNADTKPGVFRNDRSLTDAEIATIVRWVDAGASKGKDSDLPRVPTFTNGWTNDRAPDFVYELPPIPVPAEGAVPDSYYWVKNPFPEDKLVEALELRPGNRSLVHHIRVDVVALPEGCVVVDARLKAADGGTCKEPGGANDVVTDNGDRFYLIAWVPGRGLDRKAPGTAKRIAGNHWIRFNMHYAPTGKAGVDQSKLGVWFAKGPVTHEVFTKTVGQALPTAPDITRLIAEGKEIVRDPSVKGGNNGQGRIPNIPAHADNFELVGITQVTEPIRIYAFSPHMHMRGKDLKWVITWPDGREETLLDVPKYDFNWQIQYELAKPIDVPRGSTIRAIAHFDNSARNRFNPNPDIDVRWAAQTTDEMFSPFIEYTVESLQIKD